MKFYLPLYRLKACTVMFLLLFNVSYLFGNYSSTLRLEHPVTMNYFSYNNISGETVLKDNVPDNSTLKSSKINRSFFSKGKIDSDLDQNKMTITSLEVYPSSYSY